VFDPATLSHAGVSAKVGLALNFFSNPLQQWPSRIRRTYEPRQRGMADSAIAMKFHLPLLLAAALIMPHAADAKRVALPNPDFTKGEKIPEGASQTYNLGPTGARGWMHGERLETTRARQIAITEVAAGSPAANMLKVGDVILGVEGKPFAHDPRVELGTAITRAEAADGKLRLTVWREGNTSEAVVPLMVLGKYSATAPFNCKKSDRIVELGSKALAERMKQDGYDKSQNAITRSLNALALLASGNPEYLPLVRRECEWAAGFTSDSFQVWWNAYVIMLLAEYQIATGDATFADGMKRLALESARGQSIVGSWGHRFAGPDGRLVGYGMMNAPGVPLIISLILARTAGAKDPAIDTAIERGSRLIRFYIGKGAVPYGDHAPWTQTHEDNGKCGMAAVMFNFLGEKEGAEFFTRMSVASHGPERDTGHTGNFTNMLWAMPAISLAGPQATGGWMKEYGAWKFDLTRSWDFKFTHPGPPDTKPDSYRNWDATGSYLLAYATGKGKLMITGKQRKIATKLDAPTVESLLRDGRGWSNNDRNSAYDSLNETQLLECLASWSPAVRERAAMALARRARGDVQIPIDALINQLGSPDLNARYGACETLKLAGEKAAPAVPALTALLEHEDLWLRCQAAMALAHIGQAAMPALPMLMDRLVKGPTTEDPRAMEQRFLCFAVFDQMLKNSIDGVDRNALHRAMAAGLKNEDGRARGSIAKIYGQLTAEEIKPMLPIIHEAVVMPSPSGIMFADGIRIAGLEVLAKYRVEEGIQACTDYIRTQNTWGSEKRIVTLLEILETYGAHAQAVTPQLLEFATKIEPGEPNFPGHLSKQKAQTLRDAVARINAATDRPELTRLR
jgi:hypothetical protein